MTWQPIETAPKDGTEILLYDAADPCILIAFWNNHGWEMSPQWGRNDEWPAEGLTCWCRLPKPAGLTPKAL